MIIEDLNKFRDDVIKMYNEGYLIIEIADKYDIYTPGAISFILTSAGVDTKKNLKLSRRQPKNEN